MLAAISFFALAIFGLGAVSVATDADIIAVPGLGQAPGIIGMLTAATVFALLLWARVRKPEPSYVASVSIGLFAGLAHLVAVWCTVLFTTGGVVIATAVAGDLVRGGASAVLVLAAAIAAWGGIALCRTRASAPRWPWENDDE